MDTSTRSGERDPNLLYSGAVFTGPAVVAIGFFAGSELSAVFILVSIFLLWIGAAIHILDSARDLIAAGGNDLILAGGGGFIIAFFGTFLVYLATVGLDYFLESAFSTAVYPWFRAGFLLGLLVLGYWKRNLLARLLLVILGLCAALVPIWEALLFINSFFGWF